VWKVVTGWLVVRKESSTATWGNYTPPRRRELGPCGETGGLFTSCLVSHGGKTFKVHGAVVRYIQNTSTSQHYIRQRFHNVTFVTFQPRLVRFGHQHECNPSGVLARRRIRRGTLEASHTAYLTLITSSMWGPQTSLHFSSDFVRSMRGMAKCETSYYRHASTSRLDISWYRACN
jgi:hypothetical protein